MGLKPGDRQGAAAQLLDRLNAAVSDGVAVASATVVDTSRSVPRHAGAKMLVFGDGSACGTIGGGEMESRVIREAHAALCDGRPRLLSYRLVDPAKGDPGVCGGELRIFVEPHMPNPTMIVVGYGHVGRAVAGLAGWLGFEVVAVDDRAEITAEPGEVDRFFNGSVAELLAERNFGPDTSVVLVTRNVEVDSEALPEVLAALGDDDNRSYIGVMGSERRWQTTRRQLREAGLTSEVLQRVRAPIGIDVGAETPEEIAVSIMAEVIAHRRG